jgi:hypothetical protein
MQTDGRIKEAEGGGQLEKWDPTLLRARQGQQCAPKLRHILEDNNLLCYRREQLIPFYAVR